MKLMFRNKQRGQAIVEQIILWPTLILLTLGTLQMALLYKDKAVFNDAVFRAAREGALNHAFINPMNKKLVEALVPLYQKKEASESAYFNALATAFADNAIDPISGASLGLMSGIRIDMITPNRSVFDAFSKTMNVLVEGCEQSITVNRRGNDRTNCKERKYRQIPNDNLNIRPTNDSSVVISGENVRLNIQDANLIKIQAHWCAPLIVPFGRYALYQWSATWASIYASMGGAAHPFWPRCKAKTDFNKIQSDAGNAVRIMYVPVSSDAVVRMQSAIRCEGDEITALNCSNLK